MKIIRTCTKETVWYERYYSVPEDMKTEDIVNAIDNGTIEAFDGEYLLDTSENMTPEENNGDSTFNMYEGTELLYSDEIPKTKVSKHESN